MSVFGLLERIDFDRGTKKTELSSVWNARFQQLSEFKVKFGHCLVSVKYPANLELGRWVSQQRRNYRLNKEGKPSAMTAERSLQLDVVGFDWGISNRGTSNKTGLALSGAYDCNKCVNTRHNLVTAACQTSTLPTLSSGGGLRINAGATG